jgi:hypothetical protein
MTRQAPRHVRIPEVLSAADIDGFRRRGWVRVPAAFAEADALAMREFMWRELHEIHGAVPADPATWRWGPNRLNRHSAHPAYAGCASPRLLGAISDLFGTTEWRRPRNWGVFLVNPPNHGVWTIPHEGWHWDAPAGLDRQGLFIFTFCSPIRPRGGGTLFVEGSHQLMERFYRRLIAERLLPSKRKKLTELFIASHPWITRLHRWRAGVEERIAAFMEQPTEDGDLTLRVIEATGDPGDAIICDSAIYHSMPSGIGGDQPRFMRTKVLWDDGGTPSPYGAHPSASG